MEMTWPKFSEWAFLGMLSGGMWLFIRFIDKVSNSMDGITKSVTDLSQNMAIQIVKIVKHDSEIEDHSKRLNQHEERIVRVETKVDLKKVE